MDKVIDVNVVCAEPSLQYSCDELVDQAKSLFRTVIIVLLVINFVCCVSIDVFASHNTRDYAR